MLCLPRQVRAFSHALESRLRWSPSSSYASGRCLTTASASNEHELATKDALRKLLRETAQPVAVVTSYYPFDGVGVDFEEGPDELGKVANATTAASTKKFHGATLSSFSSIALDPYPLIAFSLRIPSRMATSLKQLMLQHQHQQQQSSPSSSSTIPPPSLVVNLLSSTQSSTAHHFARADLFPDPFRITPHTLNADNLPVLTGSLGSLTCSLVSCIPLHTLSSPSSPSPYPPSPPSPYPSPLADHSPNSTLTSTSTSTVAATKTSTATLTPPTTPPPKDGLISELFISRVIRVEPPHIVQPPRIPTLYYTTIENTLRSYLLSKNSNPRSSKFEVRTSNSRISNPRISNIKHRSEGLRPQILSSKNIEYLIFNIEINSM
ncbi:flavin reductase like domain-containing [Pyrrhoderma noxium]|uniref:Flavin reductase like domain-containing n=1 Tax=Pyrrhoderma noxium TaxID=2282107 RepID=A0A286UKB2_9AGAM|nr:flavin reductase like domain-containing [Pyrrhoderma noxium]